MTQWDIKIKAGETLRETIKLKQDGGLPVDLTGASAKCQIRKTTKSSEVLAAPSITIIDAANGEMELLLGAAVTGALPTTGIACGQEDPWAWDAFITYADGSTDCLWEGTIRVRPRVTAT